MGSIRDEVAKNMLYYRKKSGLTQKELADKLGVKNTAVSNWESGNNSVDIETLFLAADILGVSIADMYGQHDPSAPFIQDTAEGNFLLDYRQLNPDGQRTVREFLNYLISTGRYSAE